LYFLPEPQGQASLRPTLPQVAGFFGSRFSGATTAFGVALARAVAGAMGRLPAPLALGLGRRFGDLTAMALPRRRRVVLRNLALAFPDLPDDGRRRLARRSWQHLGMTVVEMARVDAKTRGPGIVPSSIACLMPTSP
jgi:lauroyl/myristoyl acyltransferase